MTDKHSNHTSEEATTDITSAFRADFSEPDTPATARAHDAISGIDELSNGSALLVIKRGPNAGSRFALNQPVTSAGRHPNSDIFCDDITVSRRHAEFRVMKNNDVQIVDVGSLNGTYVNRVPVDSAVLANGDEVQLGKFRLVFLTGGPQAVKGRPRGGRPGSRRDSTTLNDRRYRHRWTVFLARAIANDRLRHTHAPSTKPHCHRWRSRV